MKPCLPKKNGNSFWQLGHFGFSNLGLSSFGGATFFSSFSSDIELLEEESSFFSGLDSGGLWNFLKSV